MKDTNPMKTLALFVSILSIVMLSCQSQKTDISLKLKQHDSFKFRLDSRTEVDQEMDGEKNTTIGRIYLIAVQTVDTVYADGSYLISMYYDSLENVVDHSLSQDTASDPLSELLGNVMVRKAFYMRVTPKWQILDVMGLDIILKRMMDEMMASEQVKANAEQMKPVLEKLFAEQFSKEKFVKMFQTVSGAYPAKPVKAGDKWDYDEWIDVGMAAVKTTTQYELKEVENGLLKIQVKTNVNNNDSVPPTTPGSLEMKWDIKGIQEGEMILDSSNCLMSGTVLQQEMAGTMQMISGENEQRQETGIPIKMKRTINMITEKHDPDKLK